MRKKSQNKKAAPFFILLAAAIFLLSWGSAYAVKIIPPRLVIGPDQNVAHVFIKNSSSARKAYRFGWKHLAMTKDGEVVNLDRAGKDKVPDYKPADDILRYSPRRAVLEPGDTQRVTFLVRRSATLEPGEYRSHFLVEQEESADKKEKQKQEESLGRETAVGVELVVSRAFPVYVLQGETDAKLNILSAEVQKNENRKKETDPAYYIEFRVRKEGNRSIIGTADAFCGEDKITKAPRIFAVYAEGEFGTERLAVYPPAGGCSSMRLVLTAHRDDVLAGQVLGEIQVKM